MSAGNQTSRPVTPAMAIVLADVVTERERQNAKWGEQNHDPITWVSILTEEVGEFAEAALHQRFGGPKAAGLREEAIQAAAVAVQIVECLDRGKWKVARTSLEMELIEALKKSADALEALNKAFSATNPSLINPFDFPAHEAREAITKAEGDQP